MYILTLALSQNEEAHVHTPPNSLHRIRNLLARIRIIIQRQRRSDILNRLNKRPPLLAIWRREKYPVESSHLPKGMSVFAPLILVLLRFLERPKSNCAQSNPLGLNMPARINSSVAVVVKVLRYETILVIMSRATLLSSYFPSRNSVMQPLIAVFGARLDLPGKLLR